MKATEQYFPVVLFIMLYKVVLTFESVDEILKCDHSNESYWAVLSCGTVYYAVQGDSNFWVCGWNPKVWPFKWKIRILSSTFPWCLLCCATWLQLMLKCDHLEKNLLSSICNDTNIFKRALHSEMFMFIFLKFDSLWTPLYCALSTYLGKVLVFLLFQGNKHLQDKASRGKSQEDNRFSPYMVSLAH